MRKSIIAVLWLCCCMAISANAQFSATLTYQPQYPDSFKAHLDATGLQHNHEYALCLNGYRKHTSNDSLTKISPDEPYNGEAQYNFETSIRPDTTGSLHRDISLKLLRGEYRVKFLIKDMSENWAVKWHKDNMQFTVTKPARH